MEKSNEVDYLEKLREQTIDAFNFKKAQLEKARDMVPDTQQAGDVQIILPNRHERRKNLKVAKAQGAMKQDEVTQGLPRYLLAALESGDIGRVEACIDKAMGEGWSQEDLEKEIESLTGAE